MIVPGVDYTKANKEILYVFMFSGNVVDDWMDYYWTKEDVGKKCFMEFLSNEYKKKYFNSGEFFNIYSFVLSGSHLTKTIFHVQNKYKFDTHINHILPALMIVVIFTGPISIFLHKLMDQAL